jgi:hypothetical protein
MDDSPMKSETSTVDVRPAPTPTEALHAISLRKKIFLLALFTVAQFLDVAGVSMVGPSPADKSCLESKHLTKYIYIQLLPAAPKVSADLHLVGSETSWLFASYGSTFAAFLLIVSLFFSR